MQIQNSEECCILLQKYCKGQNYEAFAIIERNLTTGSIEDKEFISLISGIGDNIGILGNQFDKFIVILLNSNWLRRSDDVIQRFKQFILHLLSAHTYRLETVFRRLLTMYLPDEIEDSTVNYEIGYQHIHSIFTSITTVVPLSPTVLPTLLGEKFPYLKKDARFHIAYTKNILDLCSFQPALRRDVLLLITKNMIEMDVRCSREDILLAEEEPDDAVALLQTEEHELKHPIAKTLDSLMLLMMKYIDVSCQDSNSVSTLFDDLQHVFSFLILPTHACCHVQYLMFYFCSLKSCFCMNVLDRLWKNIENPNTSMVVRQNSASYIASWINRASYISCVAALSHLEQMCQWLHRYINNQESRRRVDVIQHGVFYSVCQAVFYVTAFRHKEFVKHVDRLKSFNFQRLITCSLNPLKVCDQMIVRGFRRFAHHYQVAYCSTIMENNERTSLSVALPDELGQGTSSRPLMSLQSFFPFESYVLFRSKPYITNLYREYDGGTVEVGIASEIKANDNNDFLNEDLEVSSVPEDTMLGLTTGTCDHNKFGYGMSPGFMT